MRCTTFDLPVVEPIAKRNDRRRRAERSRDRGGASTSLPTPCPKADVITMGLILHDWTLERKMHLVKAAYDALPDGGAFIVVENLIDDGRRTKMRSGSLMSLNMLIEFGDAFDYTGADFAGWCKEVGFKDTEVLTGPAQRAPDCLQVGGRRFELVAHLSQLISRSLAVRAIARVPAAAAVEEVVAGAADEGVPTPAAAERVPARAGAGQVGSAERNEGVLAPGATG